MKNKRNLRALMTLIMVMVLGIVLASCGDDDNGEVASSIVGSWYVEGSSEANYEFMADGKLHFFLL